MRVVTPAVVLLASAAVMVGGTESALAGTNSNPCPSRHASTTPVRDMAPIVLVCQPTGELQVLGSGYRPGDNGRLNCPRDYYVRGSHSGSPYAQWDYAAGPYFHTFAEEERAPSGYTNIVTWGGILRAWEANGRWTGGVAPLLTTWQAEPVRIQVFFYCEPGPPWPAQTRSLRMNPLAGSADNDDEGFPVEDEEGSPPPSDAESAPESPPGVEADPPEPEWIVETLDPGEDTLVGPDGFARLVDDEGDDTLIGGTGEQTLVAGLGNNTLRAGRGDQTLIGGPGRDTLIGGTGHQGLFTAGAHNRIVAGKGPSTIAALGRGSTVDCRNQRATVVAIRSVRVKRCRTNQVRRVKAPAWTLQPHWVLPRSRR